MVPPRDERLRPPTCARSAVDASTTSTGVARLRADCVRVAMVTAISIIRVWRRQCAGARVGLVALSMQIRGTCAMRSSRPVRSCQCLEAWTACSCRPRRFLEQQSTEPPAAIATGTPPNPNNNLGFPVGSTLSARTGPITIAPGVSTSRPGSFMMSTVRAEVRQASPLILAYFDDGHRSIRAGRLTRPLNTPNFTLLCVQYCPMRSRICCSCSPSLLPQSSRRTLFPFTGLSRYHGLSRDLRQAMKAGDGPTRSRRLRQSAATRQKQRASPTPQKRPSKLSKRRSNSA
jgi:hypothetical protein